MTEGGTPRFTPHVRFVGTPSGAHRRNGWKRWGKADHRSIALSAVHAFFMCGMEIKRARPRRSKPTCGRIRPTASRVPSRFTRPSGRSEEADKSARSVGPVTEIRPATRPRTTAPCGVPGRGSTAARTRGAARPREHSARYGAMHESGYTDRPSTLSRRTCFPESRPRPARPPSGSTRLFVALRWSVAVEESRARRISCLGGCRGVRWRVAGSRCVDALVRGPRGARKTVRVVPGPPPNGVISVRCITSADADEDDEDLST